MEKFFPDTVFFYHFPVDSGGEKCYNAPMEQNRFLTKRECVKIFPAHEETDLKLISAGYNDFLYVKPQYFLRTQSQYTVHFVLNGRGTLNVESRSFAVEKHQIFLLDNKCKFSYYPDEKDPWEYIWFDFYGNFAPVYAAQCNFSARAPIAECAFPQKLESALFPLFSGNRDRPAASYFEFLSAFFLLMSSVAPEKNETAFFYQKSYIEEIKKFIELNCFSGDLSVEYLARAMHISHSHLCKIFKKSEGISVVSYVAELRLRKAAELLKKTGCSAREIAEMSGFGEYEYFLKSFKRRFGVTTGEYRAKQPL